MAKSHFKYNNHRLCGIYANISAFLFWGNMRHNSGSDYDFPRALYVYKNTYKSLLTHST